MRDERIANKIYDAKVRDKSGRGRPRLTFKNTLSNVTTNTWRRSRKMYEDTPEGMCEEVDNSGQGKRGM